MKTYQKTVQYDIIDRTTIGKVLDDTAKFRGLMYIVDGNNEEPEYISNSLAYLGTLNKNKKIYILEEQCEYYGFVNDK